MGKDDSRLYARIYILAIQNSLSIIWLLLLAGEWIQIIELEEDEENKTLQCRSKRYLKAGCLKPPKVKWHLKIVWLLKKQTIKTQSQEIILLSLELHVEEEREPIKTSIHASSAEMVKEQKAGTPITEDNEE
jgi:hypothetical protein